MRKPRKELEGWEKYEVRKYREVGMSLNELASWFNVHRATICRALAEMREKLGPEQLPRNKRHLVRLRAATSQNLTSGQVAPEENATSH